MCFEWAYHTRRQRTKQERSCWLSPNAKLDMGLLYVLTFYLKKDRCNAGFFIWFQKASSRSRLAITFSPRHPQRTALGPPDSCRNRTLHHLWAHSPHRISLSAIYLLRLGPQHQLTQLRIFRAFSLVAWIHLVTVLGLELVDHNVVDRHEIVCIDQIQFQIEQSHQLG